MIVSSVTERFQTTIPKGVRDALGIERGDTIAYELAGDRVVLTRRAADADPALAGFLALLERDIALRPESLRPVPEAMVERARALAGAVVVDLDAPL